MKLKPASLLALIALALVSTVSGCLNPTAAQVANRDFGPRPTAEQAQAACVAWFHEHLKDPESARYEWADLHKVAFRNGRIRVGYMQDVRVNAKNSYGGYTGFRVYRLFLENGSVAEDLTAVASVTGPVQPVAVLD